MSNQLTMRDSYEAFLKAVAIFTDATLAHVDQTRPPRLALQQIAQMTRVLRILIDAAHSSIEGIAKTTDAGEAGR